MENIENEKTIIKPIIIKCDTQKMMRLILTKATLVFGAVTVFGLALFCVAFNFAIVVPNALNVILAGVGVLIVVFCCGYVIDGVKSLFFNGETTTVLYSDILVVQTYRQKRGTYAEEIYSISDFTQAKEHKKYFYVTAPFVGSAVIVKHGLSDSELNTVRKLFRLPAIGGEDLVLPPSGGKYNIPALSELVPTDENTRVIRSAFGSYYSRDKRFYLPQKIVAGLIIPACAFGMLCYGTWCYMYGTPPPVYATVVMWISALTLMADVLWIMFIRSALKQSERAEKGRTSEYLFFADGFIVFIHAPNDFSFKFVPYGKVARVHGNKTDLYIDYPNRSTTYPVIKAELSESEYNTLCALLKKSHEGNTIELDNAPNINAETIRRDRAI